MLRIRNISTHDGSVRNLEISSGIDLDIDGEHLTLLPSLIDPHVHFRTPGGEHKEDWKTAAAASVAGGVTMVLDMPNTSPTAITPKRLREKRKIIDRQLKEVGIPLRYGLYCGADQNHLDSISQVKNSAVGIKIYMGSSTGDLLMTDIQALAQVFALAAEEDLVVAVHAEDEEILKEKQLEHRRVTDPAIHSVIRDRSAAIKAVTEAIALAESYGTKLYIAHVTTREELELIRQAKKRGTKVFAEVTPHHLFLSSDDYSTLGTLGQMNPPLRTPDDNNALWEGIHDGTVDTIGTDHAPHTLEEKQQPYGSAPSGVPGVETLLPLLLNANHEGKISLEQIVALTRDNPAKIFSLKPPKDWVIVDRSAAHVVQNQNLKSKCGWSPFAGKTLVGWPLYTILKGKIYHGIYAPELVAPTSSHL